MIKLEQWKNMATYMKRAIQFHKDKNYQLASKFYKLCLNLDQDDPIAQFMLADVLDHLDRKELASKLRKKALLTQGCCEFFEPDSIDNSLASILKIILSYEKKLGSSDLSIYMDISSSYNTKLSYYHASKIFQLGDQNVPEESRTFNYYSTSGLIAYEFGDYKIAVTRYHEAVKK